MGFESVTAASSMLSVAVHPPTGQAVNCFQPLSVSSWLRSKPVPATSPVPHDTRSVLAQA